MPRCEKTPAAAARVPTLRRSCAKSLANRPGVSRGLLRAGLIPARPDIWIFGFLIQGDLLLIFLLDVFFYKQQYSWVAIFLSVREFFLSMHLYKLMSFQNTSL